jgi:transcriptional regulator GlxA family with amidase domain
MSTRRIGFLGYDGVQGIDLVGPAEAFAAVPAADGDLEALPPYQVVVIGLRGRRFVTEAGLTMRADAVVPTSMRLDTLIIPGGYGLRENDASAKAAAWITDRAPHIRRIVSVCTGIYALAPTGLLNGRRVTTHWRHVDSVARRFPELRVEGDPLFLKDGKFYTSGGITASIDLALALIEEDCGSRVALAVARELVVFLKRPGGQNQFSEPLQFQATAGDRFADLMAWIAGHLAGDLSVEALAARACLSSRQLTRVFRESYGASPAAFVQDLRLKEAGNRLAIGARRVGIKNVARSVGFTSVDGFRRAFERRFGVTPGAYRARFASTPKTTMASRVRVRGRGR